MKKVLPIIVVLFVLFTNTSSVSAYGGGNGFPPGYYNNPHHKNKLVCGIVKKQLPFNKEIYVPSCKVVKVAVAGAGDKSIEERITNFVGRVVNGGK